MRFFVILNQSLCGLVGIEMNHCAIAGVFTGFYTKVNILSESLIGECYISKNTNDYHFVRDETSQLRHKFNKID